MRRIYYRLVWLFLLAGYAEAVISEKRTGLILMVVLLTAWVFSAPMITGATNEKMEVKTNE